MNGRVTTEGVTRVRFAPSPTGYLHVGGARTLLLNWLYAKKTKGTLVVRVEDTDQTRSTREFEVMQLADVRKLGLMGEEAPDVGGPYPPYRQSERLEIYAKLAKQLLDEGRAYYCFCSDDLITQKRELALKLGKTPHYDGTCARLNLAESLSRVAKGEKAGLRFKVFNKAYVFEDHVRGRVEFKEGSVGDFFITRSPGENEKEVVAGIGFPTYNFCCAIDDHLMKITHVLRAEEHLSNTPRQLMVYDAFGWTPPEYAHVAIVLGTDRQKLSKRNGDVSVKDYLEKGYLPEALLNFVALLGWAPKNGVTMKSGHPEIISMEEMIDLFDLKGLHKAPAVFDVQKLNWMNGFYLRMYSLQEITQRAKPFFEAAGWSKAQTEDAWLQGVVDTVRNEAVLLSDLPKLGSFLIESEPSFEGDSASILKSDAGSQVAKILFEEISHLSGGDAITAQQFDEVQKAVAQKTGQKGKALFMPIRVAITGRAHGPELKKVVPLLGKAKVLARIQRTQQMAGG